VLTANAKAAEILDLAENYIRTVGYNGFSFRNLANDAGIKSASVHYHFPTKQRLAAAVASRYADRFFLALGDASDAKKLPAVQLELFISLFRNALRDDGRMCLYCILGAEFATLPEEVRAAVRRFYLDSAQWLATLLGRVPNAVADTSEDRQTRAQTIIATLEGAMIVARGSNDLDLFDAIVAQLKRHGLLPGFES
jgi:TetR/AcrR family transcriptional regulator, transcriptional repressor for nem operon